MKYKVGVIGCGRMASTIEDEVQGAHRSGLRLPYCHAGAYSVVEETEIVAACDIDEARLQTFQDRWDVPNGYTDFRELIDREKPDILSITTRPEQHAEAMIYAAENGVKGMYAEKPLCCSLEEGDAIRDAFEDNGVFLEFGPMRRNWAIFRQALELATGDLGPVKSVIGFSGNGIGGHFMDTLLYFLGDPEPVSIQGTLGEIYPEEGDDSNMRFVKDTSILSARVEFANGTALHVAHTEIGEFQVFCEQGILWIQNDGESLYVRQRDGETRHYDTIEVDPVEHWSGTERKVRELVEAIKSGRPGVSNLHATLLGLEIGFGIYESHLQGGAAIHPPVPNRKRFVSSW